ASLIGTEGGDSCGNSMSLETPECEAHGGSSNARGKRPPAVEINSLSSYPKNTDLRFTYKYIFCARKASRIFHYYFAVYINYEGLKATTLLMGRVSQT